VGASFYRQQKRVEKTQNQVTQVLKQSILCSRNPSKKPFCPLVNQARPKPNQSTFTPPLSIVPNADTNQKSLSILYNSPFCKPLVLPCSGFNGSTFQMLSAYSLMQRSLLKKPILATLVMHLVIHSSWFLYASSTRD